MINVSDQSWFYFREYQQNNGPSPTQRVLSDLSIKAPLEGSREFKSGRLPEKAQCSAAAFF